MKQAKKLLALLLVAVLVISLGSLTAFALDDDDPVADDPAPSPTPTYNKTITVGVNYKDQVYNLYQLFNATVVDGRTDGGEGISYTLMDGKTDLKVTVDGEEIDGAQWFAVDAAGNVTLAEGVTTITFDDTFKKWAENYGVKNATYKTAASDNDPNVKWTDLAEGYYFITTTTGSLVTVDSITPDVVVNDKNSPPTLDKKITAVKSGDADDGSIANATADEEKTDPGQGSNEHAIAQVGDTITYKLTIKAKPGAENYVVTDTLDAGLTPPAADGVTVSAGAGNYGVTVESQVITVTFTKAYLDSITEETDITIEYTATLNSNAVVATDSNDNTAKLTWGHNNDNNHTEDQSKVYSAQVIIKKVDGDGNALNGARFKLKKGNKWYKLDNGIVTWVDKEADGTQIEPTSAEQPNPAYSLEAKAEAEAAGEEYNVPETINVAAASFTGIPNGTYTIVETKVPTGYNKAEDTEITIKPASENDLTTELTVESLVTNNKGTELPSTGGIGTTIFYAIGGMMVVAAALLLITKKRMGNEA